jgi:aspartate oxidase
MPPVAGSRVIIIGGGLAGITAALAALDSGAQVLLLDRGGLGLGTNSALANGVFAAPTSRHDPRQYQDATLEVGKQLNRPALVAAAAAHAAEAFAFLRPHGLDLSEEATHYSFNSPRPDVFRGAEMMRALAASLRGRAGFTFRGGFQVRELLKTDDRVVGVRGWDRDGRLLELTAGAVILASGGAAAVYARNDNQKSSLGQGWLLAARAGLALWDLEFVQFYPLVLDQPGLPRVMLYPPYPKQARLLDAQGRDLAVAQGMADLNQATQMLRDAFASLVHRAGQSGPVYLDYTAVPEDLWPRYPMALLRTYHHDFRRQPVRVAPGAHFCMGGLRIDAQGRADLPGLLVCGEAAWGLHGANRRGGNALTECVVFGMLAGQEAAKEASSSLMEGESRELSPRPNADPAPGAEYRALLERLRAIAWLRAGLERDADGIAAGLAEAEALAMDLTALTPAGPAQARRRDDLMAGLLFLRGVLLASQARRESRGGFQRGDYPATGGAEWLRHSRLVMEPDGGLSLSQVPASEVDQV